MKNNDLYNKYQAGFRPDPKTTDHIYIIKTLVNKYIHKLKKPIYTCFVDFCKAFDSVWHSGLFKKLLDLKIGAHFYKIIKFMYSNSKFIAKKEKFISQACNAYREIRQGDGLRPMLFNIFTHDLPDIIYHSKTDPVQLDTTKLNCLLYADDIVLLSECELGRLPIISFITSLTFKYYSRLKELPSTRLAEEAFEVDTGLFNSGQKSWYSFISNSAKKDECQPYKFFSKGNPQIYSKPL